VADDGNKVGVICFCCSRYMKKEVEMLKNKVILGERTYGRLV